MVECPTGLVLNKRYKIIGEVGRGKTAAVYKAIDNSTDRAVAVKVLQDEVAPSDKSVERFKREAETASSLDHPNIVKMYDFGITEEMYPYVVMEYVTGMLLGTRVRVDGRLSLKTALPILIQICDGIAFAHDHGIIHRDLRPDNIFLVNANGKSDVVQIVDFGVAKRLNDANQKKLTAEGEMLGTPEYMSPEQIMGNEPDTRSDIYSMGCLMFNVLSGQLPFSGHNAAEILMQKLQGEPKDFSDPSCGRHLPADIQQIVKKALNREPDERHQSMQEIKELLEACPK